MVNKKEFTYRPAEDGCPQPLGIPKPPLDPWKMGVPNPWVHPTIYGRRLYKRIHEQMAVYDLQNLEKKGPAKL